MSRPSIKTRGFSLIELLIVIGIIATLISILLPASKSASAAQTIKCSANLRSIITAMNIYAAENKGYIPGSGFTTGRCLFVNQNMATWINDTSIKTGKLPLGTPIHPQDWMAPLIRAMGIKVPDYVDSSSDEGVRYAYYMSLAQFICPANVDVCSDKALLSNFANPGSVQATSYVTAVMFLLTSSDQPGANILTRPLPTSAIFPQLPSGYAPKLSKIQASSQKIYIADGMKYVNATATSGNIAPTYDLNPFANYNASFGYASNWTDFGPWFCVNAAWDRSFAPANGTHTGGADPRVLIYRHGGKRNGTFRMNAAFFDGHVETMDELESANPRYWMPTGTTWGLTGMPGSGVALKVYPDVTAQYGLTSTYTAP